MRLNVKSVGILLLLQVVSWSRVVKRRVQVTDSQRLKKKRTSLREKAGDFDVAAEAVMNCPMSHHKPVSALMVRETRLQGPEDEAEKVFLSQKRVRFTSLTIGLENLPKMAKGKERAAMCTCGLYTLDGAYCP